MAVYTNLGQNIKPNFSEYQNGGSKQSLINSFYIVQDILRFIEVASFTVIKHRRRVHVLFIMIRAPLQSL